jgi:hypothetical protein
MEPQPSHRETRLRPGTPASQQARLDVKSVEITAVMVKRGQSLDDELEIIDMRYQEALALANLEIVFAEAEFAGEE